MLVLPAPVAPTIATLVPAGILKLTPLSTGSFGLYAKWTSLNSISPTTLPNVLGLAGSTTVGCSSSSMNTRSAAAIAACMMLYFSAMSRIGWKAMSVYWKKARRHTQAQSACQYLTGAVPEQESRGHQRQKVDHRREHREYPQSGDICLAVQLVHRIKLAELTLLTVE